MKTYARNLIGLTLLSLAAMVPGFAEEPPPPCPGGDYPAEYGGHRGEHRGRFSEERLTQIHRELKLTTAQEADWKAFTDKVREVRAEKKEARPDFEALRTLPAPDRLQKLIEFGKARQAGLEEILTATRSFYGILTPEQRKTFDDLAPFGSHAPKWRHGRHR